jgi:hypothetical protein
MKHLLTLALLTTFLGGCTIVPWGSGYYGDGYYRGRGYDRGYDRSYDRGDRYQRDNGRYRGYDERGYGYPGRGG